MKKKLMILSLLLLSITVNAQSDERPIKNRGRNFSILIDQLINPLVGVISSKVDQKVECQNIEIKQLESGKGFRVIDGRDTKKLRTNFLYKHTVVRSEDERKVITGTSIESSLFSSNPVLQFEKTQFIVNKNGELLELSMTETTITGITTTSCKF